MSKQVANPLRHVVLANARDLVKRLRAHGKIRPEEAADVIDNLLAETDKLILKCDKDGSEPKTRLIRRRELKAWTGFSDEMIDELEHDGILKPIRRRRNGRLCHRLWVKDQVKSIFKNAFS